MGWSDLNYSVYLLIWRQSCFGNVMTICIVGDLNECLPTVHCSFLVGTFVSTWSDYVRQNFSARVSNLTSSVINPVITKLSLSREKLRNAKSFRTRKNSHRKWIMRAWSCSWRWTVWKIMLQRLSRLVHKVTPVCITAPWHKTPLYDQTSIKHQTRSSQIEDQNTNDANWWCETPLGARYNWLTRNRNANSVNQNIPNTVITILHDTSNTNTLSTISLQQAMNSTMKSIQLYRHVQRLAKNTTATSTVPSVRLLTTSTSNAVNKLRSAVEHYRVTK